MPTIGDPDVMLATVAQPNFSHTGQNGLDAGG
jgi:hypothetical protein